MHRAEEFFARKRFGNIVHGAQAQGLYRRADCRVARHHQDRRLDISFPKRFEKLDAVHFRHHQIHDNQVKPFQVQKRDTVPGR